MIFISPTNTSKTDLIEDREIILLNLHHRVNQ